jgi:lipoprotein NlpD
LIAAAAIAVLFALTGCASGLYHVVGKSETLFRIAQAYDVPQSEIVKINHLPNPDRIYVGQYLFIPGARERKPVTLPTPAAPAPVAPAASPTVAAKPEPAPGASARKPEPDPPARSAVGPKVKEQDLGSETEAALPKPVAKEKPAAVPPTKPPAPVAPTAPAPGAPAPGASAEPTVRGTHEPPIVEEIRPTLAPGKPGVFRPQWPATGAVISAFGDRGGNAHEGLDIGGPTGFPVVAAADGTVMFSGTLKGYGKLVLIKHDETYSTIYAHNRKNLVREGERVRRGQTIAEMGNTGRADVVHVHFEVLEARKPVDPQRFLPRR